VDTTRAAHLVAFSGFVPVHFAHKMKVPLGFGGYKPFLVNIFTKKRGKMPPPTLSFYARTNCKKPARSNLGFLTFSSFLTSTRHSTQSVGCNAGRDPRTVYRLSDSAHPQAFTSSDLISLHDNNCTTDCANFSGEQYAKSA
jgi:hypothetical protein